MSYVEQGIYLNLLLLQFERGDLSMDLIERYMPETNVYRETLEQILEDKFTKLANGTYCNERMATVIQEQQTKSEKRSQQTAAARASKQNKAKSVTKSGTNTVTKPVTERELELELELEKELEVKKEKERNDAHANAARSTLLPSVAVAVKRWNELAQASPGMSVVRAITDRRVARWNRAVAKAEFLPAWSDAVKRLPVPNTKTFKWQPSFDWMLSLDNVLKIVEGNYDAPSDGDTRTKRVRGFLNEE